ncbi:hypothetical protein A8535_002459 [Escherichia coli]|nr:hypothetical protein [Escherichia coli]EFO4248487.1 hypothetical protein [Escherichia coli]HCO2846675.1 hypothetical protein [Escherichia coli]
MTYSGKYLPDFFRLSSMKLVGCGHFSHTLDHYNDDPDVHLSPPNGVKAPTVTMFVMVVWMVCVVIITIQIIHTLYIYRKNVSPQLPQTP